MRAIDADYMKRQVDIHGTNKYGMLDENIRVFIDQQPTIDPEPHWIPVTERLPEIGVDVLVTEDTGGMKEVWIDSRWVDDDTGRTLWYVSLNVTAWMPLPEPYKGEKDE